MNTEFVTYEQALKLKELGFDELCFGYYQMTEIYNFGDGGFKIKSDMLLNTLNGLGRHNSNDIIDAPLNQQAVKWFLDKFNLWCYVYPDIHKKDWNFHIQYYDHNMWGETYIVGGFNSYSEAESACINKLIEIKLSQ
jgi:hypothetical protein